MLAVTLGACGGPSGITQAGSKLGNASTFDSVAEALWNSGHNQRDERDLDARVRDAAHSQGLTGFPNRAHPQWTPEQQHLVKLRAQLGELLFSDHILSGRKVTSCATCHNGHYHFADGRRIASGLYCNVSADGTRDFCHQAPPEGMGGNVVGPERTAGPNDHRNSPSAINAGLFPALMINARFFFEDPRYVDDHITDVNQLDPSYGFQVQAPENVLNTRSLLGAQAFKPTPDIIEMAGDWPTEGQPFIQPPAAHDQAVFEGLAQRVTDNPTYHHMFEEAYPEGESLYPSFDPHIGPDDPVSFRAIADAIAYFQEVDLQMTNAPWDHFLTGEDDAISEQAKRGALIFFTRGQCSSCHSGDLFSDFRNYNIGVVQIGPGRGEGDDADPAYQGVHTYDFGLEEITHERGDRFKFMTPPLRGVTLTPPYMHDGAYASLTDAILEHTRPRAYSEKYDVDKIAETAIIADGKKPIAPVFSDENPVVVGPGTEHEIHLSRRDVHDLIAFLRTLTDPRMEDSAAFAPTSLPSGLPADVAGPARYPLFQHGPIDPGQGRHGHHHHHSGHGHHGHFD